MLDIVQSLASKRCIGVGVQYAPQKRTNSWHFTWGFAAGCGRANGRAVMDRNYLFSQTSPCRCPILVENHFMTSASMHRVTRYATSHCVVLETKNAERQRHANVEPDRVADDRRHMAWPLSVGGGAKTFGLL
jgi:hypothetical protein